VLLTGDELLDGRVRDTNGHYLSASLVERGARVVEQTAVPDDSALIAAAVRRLLEDQVDLLVVSGGLGTTHDDLTMAAVAEASGLPLAEDAEAMIYVRRGAEGIARRQGWTVEDVLRQAARQALLPRGARCIAPAGLAPGALLRLDQTAIVVLPGVPRELMAMAPAVLDEVGAAWPRPSVVRVLRVHGVGEMAVAPVVEPLLGPDLEVAITAADGEITVRAAGWGADGGAAAERVAEALCARLPVYSADGRTLDELIATALVERGQSIATAESCSGGLLAGRLTKLPGSSEYVWGGVVSYANDVKADMLGVPRRMLAQYGAVSEQVAAAMAEGARSALGTTWALSTTGVAGPGGGSPEKPVGLVYLGCAGPGGTVVREYHGFGDRRSIRRQSVIASLHLLWQALTAQEGSSVPSGR